MLKIQKSRAMTRIGVPRYTARHSGKSGFVTVNPVRSPKPFPYSIAEDVVTSYYPEYRSYLPEDLQKYGDSYYDLRSKPYKYWYDKHGKRHINKWWNTQLRYASLLTTFPKKEQILRSNGNRPYSKYNGSNSQCKYCNRNLRSYSKRRCWRCYNRNKIRYRQTNYMRQRISRRTNHFQPYARSKWSRQW